ncbi:MAG: mechanosensitive ion channel family protein [Thalassovita sp.]
MQHIRILSLILALGLAFLHVAPIASAQDTIDIQADTSALDYAEWDRFAKRAETVLETGKASSEALETLRGQVVKWREGFLAAQSINKQRIATLQGQLDVLGPVPEEGVETVDIQTRRSNLNTEMTRLQAPVVAAEEAYSRSNGIIGEIDTIIRSRQADALISLGPTPVNPLHWQTALSETLTAAQVIQSEWSRNWQNELRQFEFKQNLLLIVPLGLIGLVLLLRGRAWISGLYGGVRQLTPKGGEMAVFILSLGKVLLPAAGLLFLTQAVLQTGFGGLRSDVLLNALPVWGATFLAVLWLADRLFPDGETLSPFAVPVEQRPRARRLAATLAGLVLLSSVERTLTSVAGLSEATSSVLSFPIFVLSGLALFRTAQFVSGLLQAGAQDGATVPFRSRAIAIVVRGSLIIAVLAPVLAAVGYRNAAEALIYPAIMTAGVLGVLFVLQHLADLIYATLSRGAVNKDEALIPVLIGFGLAVISLPVLAVVWGARVADLTEIWNRFLEGFQIGDAQISPIDFLTFAMVFAVGYVLTRMLQGALRSSVLPKTKIDPGGQTAIVSGIGYVGVSVAALVAITGAGIDLSSIAIVAGALSVGIGFGLQTIVSNFVSGIILLIERPVSEGDWIEVGGQMGYVRDISVRATRIETFDRTDVIIPNSDLISGQVTNYTRGNTVGRVILPVGVAYGTDTRRVEGILREIVEAHPMVLGNPAPSVLFQGFGADSLDFEIRAILRDVNWSLGVRSELNHEIAKRFTEEGIEIPFAQRDVWLRNPEVLHPPDPDTGDT